MRERLAEAFEVKAPCTWRDVLPAAGIDPRSPSEVMLVCRTVKNMVRASDLVWVGRHKEPGSRVWRAMYEPKGWQDPQHADASQALDALGQVTRNWATFD
jgi:hypothetical protein